MPRNFSVSSAVKLDVNILPGQFWIERLQILSPEVPRPKLTDPENLWSDIGMGKYRDSVRRDIIAAMEARHSKKVKFPLNAAQPYPSITLVIEGMPYWNIIKVAQYGKDYSDRLIDEIIHQFGSDLSI